MTAIQATTSSNSATPLTAEAIHDRVETLVQNAFFQTIIQTNRSKGVSDEEIWKRITLNTWDLSHPPQPREAFPSLATPQRIIDLNREVRQQQREALQRLWPTVFTFMVEKIDRQQEQLFLPAPLRTVPCEANSHVLLAWFKASPPTPTSNPSPEKIEAWLKNMDPILKSYLPEKLRIEDKELFHLPPLFYKQFSSMQVLELVGCSLRTLSAEIGNFKEIRELVLQENQLVKLPDVFDKFPHLFTLDLYGNDLRSLPPTFSLLKGCLIDLEGNHQLKIDAITISQLSNQGCVLKLPDHIWEENPELKNTITKQNAINSLALIPKFQSLLKAFPLFN
ncbi:MAG: leucine-rich repeat domain-containing protein [Verrucomicrobiota bacterium]|nr:leucine-rich repeat domain-containing protein [Verrucomicrobiota bacterium]